MSKKTTRFILGFLAGGLLLGLFGFLTAGFSILDPTKWADRFKPVVPDDDDDDTTDPTDPDDGDEEPEFTVEDFLALPIVEDSQIYHNDPTTYDVDAYENLGLSKAVYRSSENGQIPYSDIPVAYNSLKIRHVKDPDHATDGMIGPHLQLGYPGTINETHTNNEFMNGKTYSSYLTIKGLFEIDQYNHNFPFQLGEDLILFYRTELNLEWQVIESLQGNIQFNNGEEFVQVTIAFTGNNKSKYAVAYPLLLNTMS